MKATKIIHRNETRIRVDFPYNAEMVSKLRQIPDARWSKSHKAWHVPYSKEAFEQLKDLFPEIIVPTDEMAIDDVAEENKLQLIKKTATTELIDEAPQNQPVNHNTEAGIIQRVDVERNSISIEITDKNIFIKLPTFLGLSGQIYEFQTCIKIQWNENFLFALKNVN